jgi:class 3 adenylate cyclase
VIDEVFTAFDQLADRHGVEKIKTIGDAYMAVGGLPEPRPDHADAVADLALAMRDAVTSLATTTGQMIDFRIGICSGPAVAGVIGLHKFAYDLWGDTVNVASRMESHGVPGSIQVAESTYERLRDRYDFIERGLIEVKGRGPVSTWFLLGPSIDAAPRATSPASSEVPRGTSLAAEKQATLRE